MNVDLEELRRKFESMSIKEREEIVNKLEGYFNGKEHMILCNLYHHNQKYYPYSKTTYSKKETEAISEKLDSERRSRRLKKALDVDLSLEKKLKNIMML